VSTRQQRRLPGPRAECVVSGPRPDHPPGTSAVLRRGVSRLSRTIGQPRPRHCMLPGAVWCQPNSHSTQTLYVHALVKLQSEPPCGEPSIAGSAMLQRSAQSLWSWMLGQCLAAITFLGGRRHRSLGARKLGARAMRVRCLAPRRLHTVTDPISHSLSQSAAAVILRSPRYSSQRNSEQLAALSVHRCARYVFGREPGAIPVGVHSGTRHEFMMNRRRRRRFRLWSQSSPVRTTITKDGK
jgi:hypothetical protein